MPETLIAGAVIAAAIYFHLRRVKALEGRIAALEKAAHRHIHTETWKPGNLPRGWPVPPGACNHGYTDWDACPDCCH